MMQIILSAALLVVVVADLIVYVWLVKRIRRLEQKLS
jgi:hypothetical protein